MHVNDLPAAFARVVTTHSRQVIAEALQTFAEQHSFRYLDSVHGAGRTGKVFLTQKTNQAVEYAERQSADDIAGTIAMLTRVAQYGPQPEPKIVKGWDIRKIHVNGAPAILAWATWVVKQRKTART